MSALAPVPGFRLAGIGAGIKSRRGGDAPLDLAAITVAEPVVTVGVFTQNRVKAAPVRLAMERLENSRAQAVLVNSGNANAATGTDGERASRSTTSLLAKVLGCEPDLVVPCSTGVIGRPLPVPAFVHGIPRLAAELRPDGAADFAQAILTTDRGPKVSRQSFRNGSRRHAVLVIGKGAGMIHPNMATTLAFVLTDAAVKPRTLRRLLREATDATFNRITVDGDTSTNDTILAMASGAHGVAALKEPAERALGRALQAGLGAVAELIVADGEGAQHVAIIRVEGISTDLQALRIARTVATSMLVKTAMHGCDPNWGRLLAAAGRAGVDFDASRASVWIGDVPVLRRGKNVLDEATEARAAAVMNTPRYDIRLRLGQAQGKAHYTTCDLGHDYVSCNADYRT